MAGGVFLYLFQGPSRDTKNCTYWGRDLVDYAASIALCSVIVCFPGFPGSAFLD